MSRGSDILMLIIHMRCLDERFYLSFQSNMEHFPERLFRRYRTPKPGTMPNKTRCKVPSKNMHIQKKLLATSLPHALH